MASGDGYTLLDRHGLELIEAALAAGARIVVATSTDAQREFVVSLGYGAQVKGVVSIESIQRREGDDFIWPATKDELLEAWAMQRGRDV